MIFKPKGALAALLIAAAALALSACSVQPTAAPAEGTASPEPPSAEAEAGTEPDPTSPQQPPTKTAFAFPPTPTPEYAVEISPGPDEQPPVEIQVLDPNSGQVVQQLTLDKVVSGHYHGTDYHEQDLFVIHETGTSEELIRELWHYSPDGEGRKLFTASSLDYRAAPGQGLIAVLHPDQDDQEMITFLDWDGNVVHELTPEAGENDYIGLMKWSRDGRTLWGKFQFGPNPKDFFKIDTQTWAFTLYQAQGVSPAHDYDLQPDTGRLAYSGYPGFFEPTSHDRFVIRQVTITLAVYDFEAETEQEISSAPSRAFRPRWVSDDVLAYDDPGGPGRILHSLSTGTTSLLPGEDDSPLAEPQVVPDGFESLLDELASSGIDPILPPAFPVEPGQPAVHPRVETLEPGLYRVALELGEDCGGAPDCTYGTLAARDVAHSGPENSLVPILGSGPVQLIGLEAPPADVYTSGYYREIDCGPGCTEAEVTFLLDRQEYLFSFRGSAQDEARALAQAALENSLAAE